MNEASWSVGGTELPASILDSCLQPMSLLSGCSMAGVGSSGCHGTDQGRDFLQQPCPSVRSRAGTGIVTGHMKNYFHVSVHTGVKS